MKVLIADDEPMVLGVLEGALAGWGYDVVMAANGNDAWAALQSSEGPKLAIVDWMMPGLDGLEICGRVRARAVPYVYVILLTARGGKEDIVAGLEGGADDFLVKPFALAELKARLRTGRRVLELQERLLEDQKALRFEATHDYLTGISNRAMIRDRLVKEMDRASRDGQPTAVAFVDVDHFKEINDTCGHCTGDRVLCEIVERMQASVRPTDGLGRYGGEEFLGVFHHCDAAPASALAERIRRRIAAEPMRTDAHVLSVTVSLGVACCGRGARCSPEALIAAADTALYRAKAAGRNRVELATESDLSGP